MNHHRERVLEILFPRQDRLGSGVAAAVAAADDAADDDNDSEVDYEPEATLERSGNRREEEGEEVMGHQQDAETGNSINIHAALGTTTPTTTTQDDTLDLLEEQHDNEPTSSTSLVVANPVQSSVPRSNSAEFKKVVCVICLESIEESQQVSGLCEHQYHYDCLMEWMKESHDDCPTCRQLLWDDETFQTIWRDQHRSSGVRAEDRQSQLPPPTSSSLSRRQRRQERRAGFPWCRVCYAVNILIFVVGTGYLILSIVLTNNKSSNGNDDDTMIGMGRYSLCTSDQQEALMMGFTITNETSPSIGVGACDENRAVVWPCLEVYPCVSIGSGSCNGDEACLRLGVNVGDNSCLGGRACSNDLRVAVGDNSCIGVDACRCRYPMWRVPGFAPYDDVPDGRCTNVTTTTTAGGDECCKVQ